MHMSSYVIGLAWWLSWCKWNLGSYNSLCRSRSLAAHALRERTNSLIDTYTSQHQCAMDDKDEELIRLSLRPAFNGDYYDVFVAPDNCNRVRARALSRALSSVPDYGLFSSRDRARALYIHLDYAHASDVSRSK